ncbi:MAG: DUF4870 domain-containing protein [Thermoguttaceae bacterium]
MSDDQATFTVESGVVSTQRFWGMEENNYCLLMHLSQFANAVVPMAGIALPIVMWATNRDKSPVIDAHGKNIVNWLISAFIYAVISGLLCLVIVGFLTLIVLLVLMVVFPIVGAIKASNGEVWKYPMTISFIK